MKEDSCMFPRLIIKVALVPHWPFIEQKGLSLRVPVSRNIQLWRLVEVVLGGKGIAGLGLSVEEEAIGFFLMMKAEEPGEIRVDDGSPFSIERKSGTAVGPSHHHGRIHGDGGT